MEDAFNSRVKARVVRGLRCGSGLLWGLWFGGHITCPDTGNVIGKYGDSFRVFFLLENDAREKCEVVIPALQKMYNRRIQS